MAGRKFAIVALAWLSAAIAARAEINLEKPTGYVTDRAGIMEPQDVRTIESVLGQLRDKAGAFVLLVTMKNLDGEDIFQFSQRHFDRWKPGESGEDKAALIVLALAERRVRIHTGYGLEGALPDAWCASVSRQVAKGYFKGGRYSAGMKVLAVEVANRIAADANITLAGVSKTRRQFRQRVAQPKRPSGVGALFGCCSSLFPLLMIMLIIRSRSRWGGYGGGWGGFLGGMLLGQMLGGRRHGGWGGGGFGGGGFGGGGFGGGGFGGGFGGGMSGGGGGGAGW